MKTLVMLSGGIDSTYAAYLAAKSGRPVHLHHVRIINMEHRAKAEADAVYRILAWLGERYDGVVYYSESEVVMSIIAGKVAFDYEVTAMMASYVVSKDPYISEIHFGFTKDDLDTLSTNLASARNTIHAFKHGARMVYPLCNLTKQEIWAASPQELHKLTWSCRTPVYTDCGPIECGKCKTCVNELSKLK